MIPPQVGSSEGARWTIAFNAVSAAVPTGEFVRHSTRRRMTDAVLAELQASGYLAPLQQDSPHR